MNNITEIRDNEITAEQLSSLIAGVSNIAKHISGMLERQYLEQLNANGAYSLVEPDDLYKGSLLLSNTSWLRITHVGLETGTKPESYFAALQNILSASRMSGFRLLFLINNQNGRNELFLGLHRIDDNCQESVNGAMDEIASFVKTSWRGLKSERCCLKEINSKFKSLRYGKVYSLTGIPSMDLKSGYPSTLEYMMSGNERGSFSYLVVAEPVSSIEVDTILETARDLNGKIATFKSLSFTTSSRDGISRANNEVTSDTKGDGSFESVGGSIGLKDIFSFNLNTGSSRSNSHTKSYGITNTQSKDFSKSLGKTIINAHVDSCIKYLNRINERFETGKAIGMWDVGCYLFVDSDNLTSHMQIKSLLSGEKSLFEPIRVHDISAFAEIDESPVNRYERIKFFTSLPKLPVYQNGSVINHPLGKNFDYLTNVISTDELTSMINFPLHSVAGITVRETASFGRNTGVLTKEDDDIGIGNLVYFGEEYGRIALGRAVLSSHAFVAGSTGSGKSTAIYGLLDKLCFSERSKVRFMVIEPAKGEYKEVFGGCEGVKVYGTNPQCSSLLRINPFEFGRGTLLEEHVERLMDIFNACWPMYAAMPAVLKASIIRAYKSCGWSLLSSECKGERVFPTFADVIREMNTYMDLSQYSSDNKGDYKGALGTRLESLTNGIIGKIFSGKSITDDELFNENVIIDLSRVGSSETKSLLMGFLIIRQNEFRMSEGLGMNLPLRHLTILEEAHNILKNTSSFQSQDSANLVGKSVEMLTNSIAEMRTYGECFIIADQSPSMLDRAVISNTNTKIILNLPEKRDRDAVGASMDLKQSQVNEIARLERGQAVVFQRGWEEALLCKIDSFEKRTPLEYVPEIVEDNEWIRSLYRIYVGAADDNDDVEQLRRKLDGMVISGKCRRIILTYLEGKQVLSPDGAAVLFASYVGVELFDEACRGNKLSEINDVIAQGLLDRELFIETDSRMFLSMYVKGVCQIRNLDLFDNWLMVTTIEDLSSAAKL